MRHVANSFIAGVIVFSSSTGILAQGKPSASALVPIPRSVTMAQLQNIATMDGQLVQINTAVVRRSDTAQLFTFGEAKGQETHVVIPSPAIDAARVGDSVALTGLVRHYDPSPSKKTIDGFGRPTIRTYGAEIGSSSQRRFAQPKVPSLCRAARSVTCHPTHPKPDPPGTSVTSGRRSRECRLRTPRRPRDHALRRSTSCRAPSESRRFRAEGFRASHDRGSKAAHPAAEGRVD